MLFNSTKKAQEAQRALDDALKDTDYSCKLVSWDDVSRSHAGSLSAIGPNITDTYLRAADGSSLYTVRSCNWNEKLGMVTASDITLLKGNCDGKKDGALSTITLDKFLAKPYENGAQYAALTGDLHKPALDELVSIRFQTVFLPLGDDGKGIQFASEAYNYQTSLDSDPKNIMLLATTQGLSVQAGGAASKKLLLHQGTPGDVKAYWMKAEASRHKVGAEQKDTAEERADALARGSATSERFGIKAMGERFNALMTIQVPLLQKKPGGIGILLGACGASFGGPVASGAMFGGNELMVLEECKEASQLPLPDEDESDEEKFAEATYCAAPPPPFSSASKTSSARRGRPVSKVGSASAARISRGDFVEEVQPLPLDSDAVRHPDEHVTVTVVLYHAVKDGVPSAEDARAAVDELERMYTACNTSGKLAEKKFNSIKFGPVDPTPPSYEFTVPPKITEPKNTTVDIVMKKIDEFANAPCEKFLEMKLITLGAIDDAAAKEMISKKLDAFQSRLDQGNSIEQAMIAEFKLLVKGALSN